MTDADDTAPASRGGWWIPAAVALSCVAILVAALAWASAFHVQDDAYMFVRYADRFLAEGSFAWNPGSAPAYGATSLLYLFFVTAFRAAIPGQTAVGIAACSALWGAVFLAASYRILRGSSSGAGGRAALVLGFLLLALASRNLVAHFVNGMDTTLAMTVTAGLVLLWRRWERAPTSRTAALLALGGGVAYLTRPDLALFGLGIPAVVFLFDGRGVRRRAFAIGAGATALVAATLLACQVGFDSALPLSFYAKGLDRVYSERFVARYAHMPAYQLKGFALAYSPLLVALGLDVARNPLRWWREARPSTRGLLLTGLGFFVYYRFFVVQVVPFHQRFYHPALPVVLALGGRSVARLVDALRARGIAPLVLRCAGPLAVAAALVPLGLAAQRFREERAEGIALEFDMLERFRRQGANFWVGLDAMRALPTPWTLATTEVGHPGVLLPDAVVVDLAGLNETRIAHAGFDAEWLFATYAPDLIYMPHPDYDRLIAELEGSATFRSDYERFPAEELDAGMGVALRRASPLYERLRTMVLAPR